MRNLDVVEDIVGIASCHGVLNAENEKYTSLQLIRILSK